LSQNSRKTNAPNVSTICSQIFPCLTHTTPVHSKPLQTVHKYEFKTHVCCVTAWLGDSSAPHSIPTFRVCNLLEISLVLLRDKIEDVFKIPLQPRHRVQFVACRLGVDVISASIACTAVEEREMGEF
jgi:hypothetical protein